MVLTVAQMTTFFEHANQMGTPQTTVIQLRAEGIEAVADLADFDKDSLQQLADNLRHPGGGIPEPPLGPQLEPLSLLHHLYLVPNHKSVSPSPMIW